MFCPSLLYTHNTNGIFVQFKSHPHCSMYGLNKNVFLCHSCRLAFRLSTKRIFSKHDFFFKILNNCNVLKHTLNKMEYFITEYWYFKISFKLIQYSRYENTTVTYLLVFIWKRSMQTLQPKPRPRPEV